MTESKSSDLVQTWLDLDFQKTPLPELFRSIDSKIQNGVDLNVLGVREVTTDKTVHESEKYTLMDYVISQELKGTTGYSRWRAIMDFLRSKGAKPACMISPKTTPAQVILTELSIIEKRRSILIKQLRQIRQTQKM